ncbi:MAG: 16S rRNA (cytosine(1402)-N(4))-methyltransferase RsmH [Actinomycetota bacterium]|nr:16S rRNA (cytosine(1402)-N(4))-methyltransferase RsmH [Actinomycetota bacterium]
MVNDYHEPVLLKEVLNYLDLKQGDTVFDGTLGGAGHTIAIIKEIAPTGIVIGVDLSSQALSTATRKLENLKDNAILVNDNFANIKGIIHQLKLKKLDKVLLDLGLSSYQIDKSEKGFSYMKEEQLDMRFGSQGLSAYEVVNHYQEEDLKRIFYQYGEERWAKVIAANIVKERQKEEIGTTSKLAEIVEKSIPRHKKSRRGHPAKRVFQAIRIEVNCELENLSRAIEDGFEVLNKGGRMVIISYHSLEDRIVKNKFLNYAGKCTCPPGLPVCSCGAKKQAHILTKRAVKPSAEEAERNPRASSAKLRAIEKL